MLIKSPVGINEDLTGSMQLPSARYKYLKWTDLKGIDTKVTLTFIFSNDQLLILQGSSLRSPRVRATPIEYKKVASFLHSKNCNLQFRLRTSPLKIPLALLDKKTGKSPLWRIFPIKSFSIIIKATLCKVLFKGTFRLLDRHYNETASF